MTNNYLFAAAKKLHHELLFIYLISVKNQTTSIFMNRLT